MAAVVDSVTVPAGCTIIYRDSNHRYQLRQGDEKPQYVPSVSTVLDGAIPKNLSGWAERNAVASVLEVLRAEPEQPGPEWGQEEMLSYMQHLNLRWWQHRQAAALRGTSVHTAFESLSEGTVPKLSKFPAAERGYLKGMFAWWAEHEPEAEMVEVMLASLQDRFAGRTDLVAKVNGRRGIIDLKTSKSIRESHHFQLQGYRSGLRDSGYGEVDFTAVLRVGDDGTFEFQESWATEGQWEALLESYTAQKQFERDTPKEIKDRRKAA